MRRTWYAEHRLDVTFSLPTESATHAAESAACAAAIGAGTGATVTQGRGIWAGASEPSRTISIVGRFAAGRAERPILTALFAAGCEAIQVERIGDGSYRVEEWRDV